MELLKSRAFFLIILLVVFCAIFLTFFLSKKSKITKDDIVKAYNENSASFAAIEKYMSEQKGEIAVFNENNNIVVSKNGEKSTFDDSELKAHAQLIINKLGFAMIRKYDSQSLEGVVVFQRTTEAFEQGIVHLKKDDGKYGMEMVLLGNSWYYYSIGHV